MYLIEKLQNTQNVQKKAFNELEKVISSNANDLNFENTTSNSFYKHKKNTSRNKI